MAERRTEGPRPDLAPHQETAQKKLRNGKILWAGVGSGKSRVALAYYMDKEHQIPTGENDERLVVITTAKKRDSLDWEDEAIKFGIGKEVGATLAGPLIVDSWNNIHKYVDYKNCFFIFDEQRLVGYGKWVKSFLKIAKQNEWILLTATPGDVWMDYAPVFIANGFYKNITQFKREHVIYNPHVSYAKVDRYVGVGTLVRHRNEILVKMPYARETIRRPLPVWVDYDEDALSKLQIARWNHFKDEPIKNKAELFHLMRRVVHSHISRLNAVLELMEKHPKLILFYTYNYELDMIRQLLDGWFKVNPGAYAEWNGHRHQEIPNTANWVYLVQYTSGAEGWNCIETDATAFYSLPFSYRLWEQAHGRIDRLNTSFVNLYYYYLRSKADIDMAVWRSLKSKQDFQPSHFDMGNAEFAGIIVSEK